MSAPLEWINIVDTNGRVSSFGIGGRYRTRDNLKTLGVTGNLEHCAEIQPRTLEDADKLIKWLNEWKEHHRQLCERLFIGKYPAGLVYADKSRERGGDYVRLAFISYSRLELEIEKDCPPELATLIKLNAAELQNMRGKQYQVSTCGQTVLLGEKLPAL